MPNSAATPAPPDLLESTVLSDPTAAARVAMVARLEESGALGPGPVREALLALPRQILMPQAYVRRSAPDESPPYWDLLDVSRPADRVELLERLHSGACSRVGRGGAITAMSSTMSPTADLLQQLDLRTGQRVLDVGTGAGVSATPACFVCGDEGVVTLDIDPHVTAAASERLSTLGYRPATITGDGTTGWAAAGPYDRVFVSFAVRRVPQALVEQLAPGGRALMTLGTSSPSWPGLAVIERGQDGNGGPAAGGRVRSPGRGRLRPVVILRRVPRGDRHGGRVDTAQHARAAARHGARRVARPGNRTSSGSTSRPTAASTPPARTAH
ncbi:methyltransferase domain-containing protein [Streptomyces californicus]|uniref:methyltransferase domain-containing protein n=1 Tax=Streptomyces californicus TaxID=67351 RepID=UPI00296F990B|nr:methyltransferase domain-containing protein [Streptomyces californicus]MDW4916256.1 methyltransferase domain-containing protein [Streptomyces californicus]